MLLPLPVAVLSLMFRFLFKVSVHSNASVVGWPFAHHRERYICEFGFGFEFVHSFVTSTFCAQALLTECSSLL